jgi:hypothetical protein
MPGDTRVKAFSTLSVLALVVASTAGHSSPVPQIIYEEAADRQCASTEASAIGPGLVSELRSRLPEMRQLWQSVGPEMIRAVTALTNKPFEPTGTIQLTLCNMPSNSLQGPAVNMRYALKSFTETPVPLRYKVDTAFHEELHAFVDANVPAKSELLAVHASEPQCVRNHLHLLALQKAVLLSLNDSASLAQVVAFDGQLPSGCYKRAWALVDATPSTYLQYVAELGQ